MRRTHETSDSSQLPLRGHALHGLWTGGAKAILLSLLLGTLSAASPPPNPNEPLPDGAVRVQRLATDLLEVAGLPSLSIALIDGRAPDATEPTLRFALGHEHVEDDRPATPQTRYRAASVSKLFTATVLARLVESERVHWDTAVAELLPSFPNIEGVTLRHLAGHLGGIAHYRGEDRIERFVATPNVQDALKFFRDSPRVGPAGAQMQYSTHGYTLLSAALEAASDTSFLSLVEQEVAAPLALQHTGPAWLPRERAEMSPKPEGHAELYMLTPTGPQPFPKPESGSYKWAGGGLATTPTDLVRLAQAYLRIGEGQPFLTADTIDTMWTSQEVAGEPTGTGIGWRVGQDRLGRPVRHHAGSMQGARSVLMVDPERRDAIAVMTNASWNSAIETSALLLLDSWRLPPPSTDFEGRVRATVWIEPADGEPSERASGLAVWRDGALDLPELDALKRWVRSWNARARVRPIGEVPGSGLRWAAITGRGAGPGTCTETDGWSCRFRLTHDAELVIEWRAEAAAGETGPER